MPDDKKEELSDSEKIDDLQRSVDDLKPQQYELSGNPGTGSTGYA